MTGQPAAGVLIFAAFCASILAACSGGSDATSPTATQAAPRPAATAAAEATSAPAPATPTSAPAAATPSPASPSPTLVATAAPAATPATEGEVAIEGTIEFVEWTADALELIAAQAPDWYEQVVASIETIVSVPAGSGMDVFTKTYLVGEVTAYAPGFSSDQQLIWYAGTIVHDSCHSERYEEGLEYHGKDAEVACLTDQKAALELLDTGAYFRDYVQGLIDGADDPANSYWTNPDRHW